MTPDGPARPGAILLAAPPVHPPPTGLAADPPLRLLLLFFAYLLLALLFHAAGLNVFHVLIGGGDGFTAGLPSKLFATQLSAWNPYVQLGQYSFANTQFQPFYPPALLILGLFTNTLGYNLFILIHYAFAGLFTYLFVRNLGLGSWACFVGGLIFMLSGFLSAHKGHQAMMSAAIWLPLMLLFVDRFAGNLRLREIASASLAWAMSILAGFPQVTVYAIVVVAAYTVYRVHTSGRRGWHWLLLSASALASVSVIAILLSSLQIFAVAEALPQMTREKLTYAAFSENYLPVYHSLALIMPNLFGGFFRVQTYSPEFNVVEVYSYMGLLPLALAYAAIRYRRWKHSDSRFWAAVIVLAFVIAIGQTTPLNLLLFHVPVYNLFRAPARHLLELDFAIAVLAAMTLDGLLRPNAARDRHLKSSARKASTALALAFGVVYVVAQTGRWASLWLSQVPAQSMDDRAISPIMRFGTARNLIATNLSPMSPTILLPAIFLVLSFAALRILAAGKLRRVLMATIPLLIVADLYSAYHTLYPVPDTSMLGRPQANHETAFLAAQNFDRDLYRIFTLDQELANTYPLLNMTYGWSAVNDYTPMWLKRYVAMTDFGLNGAMPPQNLRRPNVLNAAGARYLIARSQPYVDALKSTRMLGDAALLPLVANPSMTLDHALPKAAGSYQLQAVGEEGVSLMQTEIPLEKSTSYQITFTAYARAGVPKPLLVNLYAGPSYDNAAQYAQFAQIPAAPTQLGALINSGPAAPNRAWLRIYSQSTSPIDVGDIHVSVVRDSGRADASSTAYQEVHTGGDGITVFYNAQALPRFRFAEHLRPCRDSFEARRILDSDMSFHVATDALVEGISEPMTLPPGKILSREISNNRLTFKLQTGDRGFFVIGDSWFPGWSAKVDGKEVPVFVVDGFLQGILLTGAGEHNIEMAFHPWSVPAGAAGTLAGLIAVGLGFWRSDRVAGRILVLLNRGPQAAR